LGLEKVLDGLDAYRDDNLLVGPETADDAGVYRISPSSALVETADIITPLVDDPYIFGKIAATNAISDVYAMGARPVTAMNLVFFPACSLPETVLHDILAGGSAVMREARVNLAGGHTVEDRELKYGLSVSGLVDPDRIIRNSTAQTGDVLILTKPLGTGIIATAIKGGMATDTSVATAINWMTTLNRDAAALMLQFPVHACTDVTGFGLIGHSCEMARGAGVTICLDRHAIPLMDGVLPLIADGMVPAGCYRNRDCYLPQVAAELPADALLPLFDPQTSGGLLISLTPDDAGAYLTRARDEGIFACVIGRVKNKGLHPVEIGA